MGRKRVKNKGLIGGMKDNRSFVLVLCIASLLLLLLILAPVVIQWLFGFVALIVMTVFPLVLYFLPTFVAQTRDHDNVMAIGVANFFFGWTVVGWILCLIWAVKK